MSRLVSLQFPASFVTSHGFPSSAEIGYGISEGWLSRQDAVEVALAKYKAGVTLSPAEEELALLLSSEIQRVDDLLSELESSGEPVERRARYWLYVALSWVFEHRSEYSDPLQVIEMLWADFGHPDEVHTLIRFMPQEASENPGIEAIERRWQAYLDRVRGEYKARG